MGNRELVVSGGTLIDGVGGRPLSQSSIYIEDGKFRVISQGSNFKPPVTAEVIDASGKFVLPGLMNANVHLLDGTMMAHGGAIEYLVRFEGRYHEVIEEAAQIALQGG